MAHIASNFPTQIELGAVKRFIEARPEVVLQDSGHTVRNQRRSRAKRAFDVAMPHARRDNANYLAVLQVWEDSEWGTHTFNFTDWTDETGGTIVKVRFDTELSISTAVDPRLDHIDTLTLVEEFDD